MSLLNDPKKILQIRRRRRRKTWLEILSAGAGGEVEAGVVEAVVDRRERGQM